MVKQVFSSVADSYDIMNDAMSLGIHRVWKEQFICSLDPVPGCRLLDVAGGTGDIAFRFLQSVRSKSPALPYSLPGQRESSVVVCDVNKSMLQVGYQRALDKKFSIVPASKLVSFKEGVNDSEDDFPANGSSTSQTMAFVIGDAQTLPFADNSFDAYTISFGLRNVTDIDAALREARRVLREGGRFMCMEFSRVENALLRQAYDAYSFGVIPWLGEVIAHDRASYQYLVESIRKFPSQEELLSRMEDAGLTQCTYDSLSAGIAAIHTGYKFT